MHVTLAIRIEGQSGSYQSAEGTRNMRTQLLRQGWERRFGEQLLLFLLSLLEPRWCVHVEAILHDRLLRQRFQFLGTPEVRAEVLEDLDGCLKVPLVVVVEVAHYCVFDGRDAFSRVSLLLLAFFCAPVCSNGHCSTVTWTFLSVSFFFFFSRLFSNNCKKSLFYGWRDFSSVEVYFSCRVDRLVVFRWAVVTVFLSNNLSLL